MFHQDVNLSEDNNNHQAYGGHDGGHDKLHHSDLRIDYRH